MNGDGTISPKENTGMVIGLGVPDLTLVEATSNHKCVFDIDVLMRLK